MAKKQTTMEKIHSIRGKCTALGDTIRALQFDCPHTIVKSTLTACGFNGYSTDYTTSCVCTLCDKSWFHDGYCGGDHTQIKTLTSFRKKEIT
jgi:hypothetical protein